MSACRKSARQSAAATTAIVLWPVMPWLTVETSTARSIVRSMASGRRCRSSRKTVSSNVKLPDDCSLVDAVGPELIDADFGDLDDCHDADASSLIWTLFLHAGRGPRRGFTCRGYEAAELWPMPSCKVPAVRRAVFAPLSRQWPSSPETRLLCPAFRGDRRRASLHRRCRREPHEQVDSGKPADFLFDELIIGRTASNGPEAPARARKSTPHRETASLRCSTFRSLLIECRCREKPMSPMAQPQSRSSTVP